MKKFWMFLILLLMPIMVFCQQDSTLVASEIPVPDDIFDILKDLKGWFASTTGVAGLTIFLTVLITKVWTTITPILKQVVALVVALVLMAVGNFANIGFMANFDVLSTIIYGLIVGFTANGFYDLKNAFKK